MLMRLQAGDEADAARDLARGRLALQRPPQRQPGTGRRIVARVPPQVRSEYARLFMDERAVDKPEGLRRLRRREADRAGEVGIGAVETRQERHRERAFDMDVDAPTRLLSRG